MRNFVTVIIIGICIIIFVQLNTNLIDFNDNEEDLLAETSLQDKDVKNEETISIIPVHKEFQSMDGIGSWIGKTEDELLAQFGEPDRIDLSPYDYNWWVYNNDLNKYVQFGVNNGEVVTAFVIGADIENEPFVIGTEYNQLKERFTFETAVTVEYDSGSYRFQLKEEDIQTRPFLNIGDMYVQLYFDSFEGTLSSVRYLNKETIIKQRPYELVYRGELLDADILSEVEWKAVENGTARQILDFTNIIRERFDLPHVEWDEETAHVAYLHSKDMKVNDYFSHSSPTEGTLSERLSRGSVTFLLAGENIAAKYVDGVAAVEGWLNSEGHRKTLLNENFTHLGVGVYEKYYTQNFIQTWKQ